MFVLCVFYYNKKKTSQVIEEGKTAAYPKFDLNHIPRTNGCAWDTITTSVFPIHHISVFNKTWTHM